tara:strand:- start:135260 stop:135418 length:159 start_codon:yes stop_codon:yes gene_type:complete
VARCSLWAGPVDLCCWPCCWRPTCANSASSPYPSSLVIAITRKRPVSLPWCV